MATPFEIMQRASSDLRCAWKEYFSDSSNNARPDLAAHFARWSSRIPVERRAALWERMLDAEVFERHRNDTSLRIDDYLDHPVFQGIPQYQEIVDRVFRQLAAAPRPGNSRPLDGIREILMRLADSPIGTVLAGKYKVKRRLDRGGFGVALVASEMPLNRDVVLKIPCPKRWPDRVVDLRRLADPCHEAQRQAKQDAHPNIVRVHTVDAPIVDRELDDLEWLREFGSQLESRQACWIVMEYVEGENLRQLLQRQQRLEAREAARILSAVCGALHHAHSSSDAGKERLLHRDLKPENVLIDSRGNPKLADFGLAIPYEGQARGWRAGTLEYMSPRQLAGERLDPQDDIWSIGVILYELLTGRRPFTSESSNDQGRIAELLEKTRERNYLSAEQAVSDIGLEIPADLSRVCDRCFARERSVAFSTAGELSRDLDEWLRANDNKSSSYSRVADELAASGRRRIGRTLDPERVARHEVPDLEALLNAGAHCVPAAGFLPVLLRACRERKVSLVVGPGVSSAAGMPVRERLIERLKREIKKTSTGLDDLVGLADTYLSNLEKDLPSPRAARLKLLSVLVDVVKECEKEHAEREFGPIYPRIATLPIDTFFLATWDKLLASCLKPDDHSRPVVYDARSVPEATGAERQIICLYGQLDGPDQHIVVTGNDYWEYREDSRAGKVYRRLVQELSQGRMLLCLGWTVGELRQAEFFRDAIRESRADYRVVAVLPSLSPHDAQALRQRDRIAPVSLGCEETQTPAAMAEFLDALNRGLAGHEAVYVSPSPPGRHPPTAREEIVSEYDRMKIQARSRLTLEGFRNPGDWFVNLPAGDLPRPNRPPAHNLLKTVFVDRKQDQIDLGDASLRDWLKDKLRDGGMAGITGLLGLGGVGKTYLAQRVAWDLHENEDWDIVWVSLHERGTEEAVDAVAAACGGLRFADALKMGEKLLALEWLFERIHAAGRRTLVVLDNAERFPNLPLLLRPLMRLPVLVTSRIEECNDIVAYRRLRPMSNSESMELCEKFLNAQDENRFRKLPDSDKEDLRNLCEAIGGHPLGIRLALTGYLRLPLRQRTRSGLFAEILRRVKHEGVETLAEATRMDTGQAGEKIHQSVFSTFEWLFSQLPEFEDRPGESAKLVLPVVALFATVPVSPDSLAPAIQRLIERCDAALRVHSNRVKKQEDPAFDSTDATPTFESEDTLPNTPSSETTELGGGQPSSDLPPAWIPHLAALADPATLNGALDLLNHVSLLDADEGSDRVVMHPLIREFAFAERSAAPAWNVTGEPSQDLTANGPSLFALFACAVDVMSGSTTAVESLLDLASRIKNRARPLAEQTCRGLSKTYWRLYSLEPNWPRAVDVLHVGIELAQGVELRAWHGRFLATLGEMLDRMEDPAGLPLMQQALEILQSTSDPTAYVKGKWAAAYVHSNSPDGEVESHLRQIFAELRGVLDDFRLRIDKPLLSAVEGHLAAHVDGEVAFRMLGCTSISDSFLSNALMDLQLWLDSFCVNRDVPELIARARDLYQEARWRSSNANREHDAINPDRLMRIDCDLLAAADCSDRRPWTDVARQFEKLLEQGKQARLRGFYVQSALQQRGWVRAVLEERWNDAVEWSDLWIRSAAMAWRHRREFGVLMPRLARIASELAAGASLPSRIVELDVELMAIERDCEKWGCNHLLGWLLIARALWHAQPSRKPVEAAVRRLLQSRRAFAKYTNGSTLVIEQFYARAVALVDRDRRQYESLREQIGAKQIEPPDYCGCLLDRKRDGEGCLPRRVRSRRDGKIMRLVDSGLQPGPDGKETWLYPFYIDEEPVTLDEFSRFAVEVGLACLTDGEPAHYVVAPDRETARSYATWAGKLLPNLHEWYAATWQLAAGNSPETWRSWDRARDGLLKRIERAIRDQLVKHERTLPERKYAVSDAEKRAQLEYYFGAAWISESPVLTQLLHERVVSRIVEHHVAFPPEGARELAMLLAVSFSLTRDERIGIVRAIPSLSDFQLHELTKILLEEKSKFLAMDETHYSHLLGLAQFHRVEFLRVLAADSSTICEALDPTRVFGNEGPGSMPEPINREEASRRIIVASVGPGELDSVWSGMTGDEQQSHPATLSGDPFSRPEWVAGGVIRAGVAGLLNIGVRCVLPLYTARDLDLVEPLDDPLGAS